MLVGGGDSAVVGESGVWVSGTGALVVPAVSPVSGATSSGTGVLVGTDAMPGAGVVVKVGLSVFTGAADGNSRRETKVLVVQARTPAIIATAATRMAHCFLVFVFAPPHTFVGLGT